MSWKLIVLREDDGRDESRPYNPVMSVEVQLWIDAGS